MYITTVLLLALAGSLLVRQIQNYLPDYEAQPTIIFISSPRNLNATERHSAMAAFTFPVEHRSRTVLQMCKNDAVEESCQLIATRPLEGDRPPSWRVVRGQFIPEAPGTYQLTLFIQRPWGHDGHRSVGQHSWSVDVK